jgi:hypothetical protein
MKLVNQIIELESQLDQVVSGEDNALAISNLDRVNEKIDPSLSQLKESIDYRNIFSHLPDLFAITDLNNEEVSLSLASLEYIDDFLNAWESIEQKHSIIQNDICSSLRDSISLLSNSLNRRNTEQHRAWIAQMKSDVEVLTSQLEQQENTPNLRANAQLYRNSLSKFLSATESGAITEESIDRIMALRDKVLQYKEAMVFDQPEDVTKLFKYLKQPGNGCKAPLSMLTKEVLDWVDDNSQQDYFFIIDSRIR